MHNKCSGIHANEYIELQVQTTSATWICPTCDIMNFSDSFFENTSVINIENKLSLLENHQNNPRNKVTFQHETTKQRIIKGKMKLMSININGIRGKKNHQLSSFLEVENPDIIAIQETKVDKFILTSELLPNNLNFDVYRNDSTFHGGGVILLVNKTFNAMPLYILENGSESVWAKVILNESSHYFGCWYNDPEHPVDHIQLLK